MADRIDSSWDVIVIGAGLGGLRAATRLARTGLRVADLMDPVAFAEVYAEQVKEHNPMLEAAGVDTVDFEIVTVQLEPTRAPQVSLT